LRAVLGTSVHCREVELGRYFAARLLGQCEVRDASDSAGFGLPELLIVCALIAVVSAVTVPFTAGALARYRLNDAARAVAGQIRSARLAAVTGNRAVRVRFNCPGARSYRFVEVTGDPAIDNAADRCSFAWPDLDPNALPNRDGAPMLLPDGISFGPTQDLEVATSGRISPLAGAAPASIQVTNGTETRQITASAAGRIQSP
jgi:prepilin-type N-terminal cleavage/methylation domain-containing protein